MGASFRLKLNILLSLFFVIFALQINVIVWPEPAGALAWNGDWFWSDGKPTVFESTPTTADVIGWCYYSNQNKQIDGLLEERQVCINEGKKVSFGSYYYGSGWTYPSAVGFAGDEKMYRLNSPCYEYGGCLYLPGTDTLVTKQHLINEIVHSLVVYKNFSKRIHARPDGPIPSISYDFDSSNPDYIFRSEPGMYGQADGYAWPVGGFGASENGKWLAVEFRQRGVGLLDVENLQMKRVSTQGFSYDIGFNPNTEFAVSNSGVNIAIMGSNAGINIFDVLPGCGDEPTDSRMAVVAPIDKPCTPVAIDSDKIIQRFFNGFRPKYNGDGGVLDFYATSYQYGVNKVTMRAWGYTVKKLDYLALGDSFSSGEGDSNEYSYRDGTNKEFEKCHLSNRSYPYLVARSAGISSNYMKSVACSGAMTVDVLGVNDGYWGQGERLGQDGLKLTLAQKIDAQEKAMDEFLPGRARQISFVRDHQPRVITIGIGGNDAGFMEKLKACLGPNTCSWADNDADKEKTAIEIKRLFDTLVQTYTEIHGASPTSKIYVIGYPKIISPTGDCDALTGYLLDDKEKRFMDEGIKYINTVISDAAYRAGVKYIDIEDSFGDGVLCGGGSKSAMNALAAGDDFGPIEKLDWLKLIGQESFHPNEVGHSLIAKVITDSVGDITKYEYCGAGVIICPKQNIAPDYPSYWGSGANDVYPSQQVARFVVKSDDMSGGAQKHLILDSGYFSANSDVKIVISSTPQELGQFKVGSDGRLDVVVDLPNNLDSGYHTIHLYGTSVDGGQSELYQVISYKKPVVVEEESPDEAIDGETVDLVSEPVVVEVDDKDEVVSISSNSSEDDFVDKVSKPFIINSGQGIKGVNDLNPKPESDDNKKDSHGNVFLYIAISIFCVAVIAAIFTELKRNNRPVNK